MLSHISFLDGTCIDIDPFYLHAASHTCIRHLLVHAIQTAHEGRFTTPRRPNHGCHSEGGDSEIHIVERLLLTIPCVHVLHRNGHFSSAPFRFHASHHGAWAITPSASL